MAGDYGSIILNKGRLEAYGSAGSSIAFKQPDANLVWSNQVTAEANTANWTAHLGKIGCALLTHDWVSNSAGTGPGSAGDNSVSFGGTNASSLTNPVASIAAIAASGDYYFDYDMGAAWFYWTSSSAPSFTVTYKYGTFGATAKGWGISSTQATTYNTAIFDYCTFRAMGKAANGNSRAVDVASKKSATDTANSLFQLTHCTVANCYQFLGLAGCDGAAGDLLKVEDNAIGSCRGDTGSVYGSTITCYNSATSYISVANNTIKSRNDAINFTNASVTQKAQVELVDHRQHVLLVGRGDHHPARDLPAARHGDHRGIPSGGWGSTRRGASRTSGARRDTSCSSTTMRSIITPGPSTTRATWTSTTTWSRIRSTTGSRPRPSTRSRSRASAFYNNLFCGNYLGNSPIGYGSPSVEVGLQPQAVDRRLPVRE